MVLRLIEPARLQSKAMKLKTGLLLLAAAAQVLLAASPSSPQGRSLSEDESGVRKIRETGDQGICRVVSTVEVPHLSEEERRAQWEQFESDIKLVLLEVLEAGGIPVESGDPCEGGTLQLVTRFAKDEELGNFYVTMILQYFAHETARPNLCETQPAWVEARAFDPTRYKLQDADRDDWILFTRDKMLEINFNLFFEFVSDWKEAHGTPS